MPLVSTALLAFLTTLDASSAWPTLSLPVRTGCSDLTLENGDRYTAPSPTLVSFDRLKIDFAWDGTTQAGVWSTDRGGVTEFDANGDQVLVGPWCFGNLRLDGRVTVVRGDGLRLATGTKVVFPKERPAGVEPSQEPMMPGAGDAAQPSASACVEGSERIELSVLKASETLVLSPARLREEFSWDGRGNLTVWSDSIGGIFEFDAEERDVFVGAWCFGNLQFWGQFTVIPGTGLRIMPQTELVYVPGRE
jgi:hypothetical protein